MSRYVTCRKCGREIDKEWETYDYNEKSHRYTCLSCMTSSNTHVAGDMHRQTASKSAPWKLKIVLGGLLFIGGIMQGLNGRFDLLLIGGAIGAGLVIWGFVTKPDPENTQAKNTTTHEE